MIKINNTENVLSWADLQKVIHEKLAVCGWMRQSPLLLGFNLNTNLVVSAGEHRLIAC